MGILNEEEGLRLVKDIEKKNALKRLRDNKDFQLLILEDYLKKYPLELIYNRINDINIEDNNRKLDSVSCFKQYLDSIKNLGEYAETNIKELINE